MVIAIRGETTTDGKWTTAAEADDVRKLIEKGAANTHRDRAGGTPLHECCLMGLVEHAKVLLSNLWVIPTVLLGDIGYISRRGTKARSIRAHSNAIRNRSEKTRLW